MTKEEVEQLGWIYKGGYWWDWPVKETIYIDDYSSRPLDFRLNFHPTSTIVGIDAYERNSFDWERVFYGPCKTVEELKYLMNVFNITV